MRMVLLYVAAGVMVLVPLSTGTLLAVSPDKFRLIPLSFWMVWFVLSVMVFMGGPARVEWLIPADRLHRSMRYEKRAMVLAVLNVVWSVAAVTYLGWWS